MRRPLLVILFPSLLFSVRAFADNDVSLARRIAVFPLKVEAQYKSEAEEAWWEVRNLLTKRRRLLVASQHFMTNREVFQSRADLKPADAIILGRLLDAHALLVMFVGERRLSMIAYDGANGWVLWQNHFAMSPSLAVREQLVKGALQLAKDFLVAVPYQGFQMTDANSDAVFYSDGEAQIGRVSIDQDAQVQAGDPVQWVRLNYKGQGPVFGEGGQLQLLAEGKVIGRDGDDVLVRIDQAADRKQIKEFTMVRLPRELEKRQTLEEQDQLQRLLRPQVLSVEMRPVVDTSQHRATATAVASMVNFLLFMLMIL